MAIKNFFKSRHSIIYGGLALFHTAFTLISPFYTFPVVLWLYRHNLYRLTIAALAAPFFFYLAYFSYKRWKLIKVDRRLVLILIATVTSYVAVYETVPEVGEKLHVLNFSVLAILYYKMFSPQMKLHWALLISWIIPTAIAVCDEHFQNSIPGRDGTYHDIWIALRSAVVGGIIAWIFDSYSRKGR